MTYLDKAKQIWTLRPTKDDLLAGANYAAITLPWTFNRMMLNTSSAGQQSRAMNIAKGIVGQEVLRRALVKRGVAQEIQKKSYRDNDLFDFKISVHGAESKLDVKSLNYYTNYGDLGREAFNADLLIEHASYAGPDWRHFFPMLVPHTQIGQDKEAYCFAIASSIDFRRDIDKNRDKYALTAFPFGESLPFLSSSKLCFAREEAGKGIYVHCLYEPHSLFEQSQLSISLIGEWAGKYTRFDIKLTPNDESHDIGPFSCLSSIQIEHDAYNSFAGQFSLRVIRNEFTDEILNSAKREINIIPDETLVYTRQDFCNLVLPSDYTVHFIGWITKEEFRKKCRDYTGWVWPLDSVCKYENQPWTQITDSDRAHLMRAGFDDCIQSKPRLLRAGWMKTNGRGGGACCYVFPNIGMNGGVKETNLYVLPKDLHPMDELGK